MQIIHVPGPSKEAFNKGRRISDLIRAQVGHLKHIVSQLPADQQPQLPHHEITTEDEAARYIGSVTAFLRARSVVATTPARTSTRGAQPTRPDSEFAVAGAALLSTTVKPKSRANKKTSPPKKPEGRR